jgi:hypothetical protein
MTVVARSRSSDMEILWSLLANNTEGFGEILSNTPSISEKNGSTTCYTNERVMRKFRDS